MGEGGSGRKLIVEVCNAKNLMPKDGEGTASAYATVEFDGQRQRTNTKLRDLNPEWDEKLEFPVHDPDSMASHTLELNLYNDSKKFGRRSNFLGKVKVAGSTFVASGSQSLVYYPLEKRSVFSQIKGEIGLKICYEDPPPPAEEKEEMKEKGGGEEKTEKVIEKVEEENSPAEIPTPVPGEAPAAKDPGNPPPVAQPEKPKQLRRAESLITTATLTAFNQTNDHHLEFRSVSGGGGGSRYDLVDRMPFLYVRVVKAKRFCDDAETATPVCASLAVGSRSVKTKSCCLDQGWDQVFAFRWEGLDSTTLEVSVLSQHNNDGGAPNQTQSENPTAEACLGTVSFDLQEAPKRVPPDSPLASQWYTLEGMPEGSSRVDVMIAVWLGTQADEAFQEAWQSDSGGFIPETRAKVYLSPKLWYLRLTVIQTQDLRLGSGPGPGPASKVRNPEMYVKAQLGAQLFKTARTLAGGSLSCDNPTWNEDLVFVAAEPFEPFLVLTVEDFTNGNPVGHAKIHVSSIDRRTDDRTEPRSRWFNLIGDENGSYAGRIHVRACLEGGYHVVDEAAQVTSDVRAASKQLAKLAMGLLEVGIRGANNLLPVKTADGTHGTTDAYVVAKYGPKWVRTRTILDSFNPRWNEQYTWDVYDPCTVLTIGVFDNGRYRKGEPGKDVRMGKLRIRLSTLDADHVYSGSYSLTVFLPGGVKKIGEIEIAVRFSCPSWLSLVQAYASPTLPRMHYVRPIGLAQQDILRQTAMRIVTARLARSEPPLGQEVVQVMLDSDASGWSMRRTKANWFRIMGCLTKAATLVRWIHGIRTWAHVPTTVTVHVLFVAVVFFPHLVLPAVFMYVFLALSLRFRHRRGARFDMDPRLSCVDAVGIEEIDEEFDGLPTNRSADQIRFRYDRLRALAGRVQILLGDMAAHGERLEALSSWRDPRATGIFVVFCLFASLMLYLVPFKPFVLCLGFYHLRHPRFRGDMPSVPVNFFRRLPSLSDRIL